VSLYESARLHVGGGAWAAHDSHAASRMACDHAASRTARDRVLDPARVMSWQQDSETDLTDS
jgi:hypothetical protein